MRPFKGQFKGETMADIVAYNYAMKEFFASQQCGHVQYVDVMNMTHMLQLPVLKKNLWTLRLTYDGMHFGRTINLLKAYVILDSLG
jgi:hypothetical protein